MRSLETSEETDLHTKKENTLLTYLEGDTSSKKKESKLLS